ncbi:MAG TPA: hypothetical protein VGZ04_10105 [Acidimicrobiales bacterium]|nr:hypothetical protein [Acidimicrobiales bacterium]
MTFTDARVRIGSSYLCELTGETVPLDGERISVDYVSQSWSFECPKCGFEHSGTLMPRVTRERPPRTRVIDLPLNLDLGEIIEGQHVIIKGIESPVTRGAVIHNDFNPGFSVRSADLDTSWGLGEIFDDVGTVYDHMGAGGWGPDEDGVVRWGDENLGSMIPTSATTLSISVYCANSWRPSSAWIRRFELSLATREVSIAEYGD